MTKQSWWLALGVLAMVACGDKDAGDSGVADSGVADSGVADSGAADGGTDATDGGTDTTDADTDTTDTDTDTDTDGGSDSGSTDGGTDTGGSTGPLDGLGALSGDCRVLDDELTSGDPSLFFSTLDLTGTTWDTDALSPGGFEVWDDDNLGGSSLHSEVFAYELLYRCEDAVLLRTESEIDYVDPDGKKTDIYVTIDEVPLGVSVTRAYVWENDDDYTVAEATDLLEGKLGDILLSSANAHPDNPWGKQVLAVIAYAPDYAAAIEEAWPLLDAAVKADTVLWVLVTEGDDEYIY